MNRPARPDSLEAFLALSESEKLIWLKIDELERKLLDIAEQRTLDRSPTHEGTT
ncbi:MAG: hypothetical protein ACRCZI_15740 [Cetobacterium sp.]